MGIILIKGREKPIVRDNKIAQVIKDRWLGNPDEGVVKAAPGDHLDLGAEWAGFYGQIKSIELEQTYKPKETENYNQELTPAQREANKIRIARMRKDMEEKGMLKPKTE